MKRLRQFDFSAALGLAAGAAILVGVQLIDGGSVQSLWQPTAALVVFSGTAVALVISYPFATLRRTGSALRQALTRQPLSIEPLLGYFFDYAERARRRGLFSLESELDSAPDPFLRSALGLVVDGVSPKTCREILEIESQSLRDAAELPADVLETAAGYTPTLGILGAVLGLIHVMNSLTEPSKLGAGIAVAFVATVYGVGVANLILLPLASKLRGIARQGAVSREVVIEGVVALQEGLSPQVVEQKLRGFLTPGIRRRRRRMLA